MGGSGEKEEDERCNEGGIMRAVKSQDFFMRNFILTVFCIKIIKCHGQVSSTLLFFPVFSLEVTYVKRY